MKKIKIPLDKFIKQLQQIQDDMASIKHHAGSNSISFYVHTKEGDDDDWYVLCEDEYDPAIEAHHLPGCRCCIGAVINLMKDDASLE